MPPCGEWIEVKGGVLASTWMVYGVLWKVHNAHKRYAERWSIHIAAMESLWEEQKQGGNQQVNFLFI